MKCKPVKVLRGNRCWHVRHPKTGVLFTECRANGMKARVLVLYYESRQGCPPFVRVS